MKSLTFGAHIKEVRMSKNIPQRKVAHHLDIDTSTLSKIELGQRQLNLNMIKKLSEILEIDYKKLQVKFITENITTDYHDQPYLKQALNKVIKKIKK